MPSTAIDVDQKRQEANEYSYISTLRRIQTFFFQNCTVYI